MHDNEPVSRTGRVGSFWLNQRCAVVAATAGTLEAQSPARAAIAVDAAVPHTTIHITVNGVRQDVEVEDRWTLAELLRDRLGLTGTKIGCDRGECGARTVLIDDAPALFLQQPRGGMDGRVRRRLKVSRPPAISHPCNRRSFPTMRRSAASARAVR